MQVLVGPACNMEVSASASSSSPGRVRDRSSTNGGVPASAAQDNSNRDAAGSSSSCLFLNGENANDVVGDGNTFGSDDSSDSSSIGSPGDTEEDEEEEEEEEEDENEVVSYSKTGVGLPRNKFSMSSLEDSLTTSKRGLSNHYSGKSKSFGNLTEVMNMTTTIKDLEKEENPFNKRRRVLIANKWSRKFFYSRNNPKSMPLLPILPDDDEEGEEGEEGEGEENPETNHDDQEEQEQQLLLRGNKLKVKMGFKSQSCFCFADLAEEKEDDDDEEDY